MEHLLPNLGFKACMRQSSNDYLQTWSAIKPLPYLDLGKQVLVNTTVNVLIFFFIPLEFQEKIDVQQHFFVLIFPLSFGIKVYKSTQLV